MPHTIQAPQALLDVAARYAERGASTVRLIAYDRHGGELPECGAEWWNTIGACTAGTAYAVLAARESDAERFLVSLNGHDVDTGEPIAMIVYQFDVVQACDGGEWVLGRAYGSADLPDVIAAT